MKSKIAIILLIILNLGTILYFTNRNKKQEVKKEPEVKSEIKLTYKNVKEEGSFKIFNCGIQSIESSEFNNFKITTKMNGDHIEVELRKNTKQLGYRLSKGCGGLLGGCKENKVVYGIPLTDEEYDDLIRAWVDLCSLYPYLEDYNNDDLVVYKSYEDYEIGQTEILKYKEKKDPNPTKEKYIKIDKNLDGKIQLKEYARYKISKIGENLDNK